VTTFTRQTSTCRLIGWALLLVCGLMTAGCSSTPVTARSVASAAGIRSVLIVPYTDLTDVFGESGLIQCPLNPKYFEAGSTIEGAEETLTGLTQRKLIQTRDFQAGLWSERIAEIAVDRGRFNQERQFAVQVGRQSGADAVLIGYVYRFRQRVGEKYGAESPAAVSFSLHLLRTETGDDIWYGFFEEAQQALTENLFRLPLFLERGATWQTAEELAQYGLKELWKTFPEKASDTETDQ